MAKKEEKVVEEVQSTEIKNDQPSNKITETKVKDPVEKEGGNMKVAAKTKKVTKAKQLVQKEASISKVNLSNKKEEDVAKVDLDKKKNNQKKKLKQRKLLLKKKQR